ncbi:MAG: translation initiation factor [Nanoarchaeota archaeon]|nr:translation initiation factor [Nanoarchaeota archaeon]MBU4241883.1 translation initiation factor [Nanoarchaeota archaeon]MBU4352471.1 translation initiation factor [Nanoarchaeota archaeon]MBU4456000.1 translation initiation factor [Nanoarchaeota archaeon]MCG2719419.1 translation initiation factor [Nanoarchaeota archaeon]
MSEVCTKCGLPKDLCVCETIAKEEQQITIKLVKRKFGKLSTIIEGITDKNINIKDVMKKLKSKLACGGTVKEGNIELQGKHSQKAKECLIGYGFSPSAIKVKEEI